MEEKGKEEEEKGNGEIIHLSDDLILMIFFSLDMSSFLSFSSTCTRFHHLSRSNVLWKQVTFGNIIMMFSFINVIQRYLQRWHSHQCNWVKEVPSPASWKDTFFSKLLCSRHLHRFTSILTSLPLIHSSQLQITYSITSYSLDQPNYTQDIQVTIEGTSIQRTHHFSKCTKDKWWEWLLKFLSRRWNVDFSTLKNRIKDLSYHFQYAFPDSSLFFSTCVPNVPCFLIPFPVFTARTECDLLMLSVVDRD